ncbi:PQQ-binding-like beta-propeller repeat protein [Limnoglobus roseus]|uniref:Polyvinylalcohol dehydrogenase n=1 Tax=Limnoglobus roseus TaxID=2598579 RepID=A0A5C1AFR6_9BACT|nr:PQQ-binding-like beta-propeller repeat protein [Limnoglobus roseus]QEL16977.1 polyvinylalcohol dehydrogenase [Limnoglobus roseus]
MSSSLLIAALFLSAPAVAEGDWPQWRGPNRDGKSPETGLFANWPSGGPKMTWENLKVGIGYGSPAVVGNKIYLLGGEANAAGSPEHALCLNLSDGKEVWRSPLKTSAGKFLDGWGGGGRSTPTYADGTIYVLGATGDLVALKAADGKEVWRKNLVKDFGGAIPQWGYSESVLIDGDTLVCTPGKGTGMVAMNAKTGAVKWKCTEFKDGAGYSSIIPTDVGGVRVYVQQTMENGIGVRAKDGKLMFKVGTIGRKIAVIPTPVVADDYVFFTAGYGAGAESFKMKAEGDKVTAEKVATYKTLQNHHGGVIQVGDYVYGHSDRGGWTCLAFKKDDDNAIWQNSKFGKGAITYADGHFLCYEEKSGNLAVIKATDEGWKEDGQLTLPKRSKTPKGQGAIWAHPVVAHGKLFLRDFDYLFCFDLKK